MSQNMAIFAALLTFVFCSFLFILMIKHWETLNLIQQACKQYFKRHKYRIELIEVELIDESIDEESVQKCANGRFTEQPYENEGQFIVAFKDELSRVCKFRHYAFEKSKDNIESSEYILKLSNFLTGTLNNSTSVVIIRFYVILLTEEKRGC